MPSQNHDWTRDWTWDRIHEYHQCPECGFINESQSAFEQRYKTLEKDVCCEKCKKTFRISKVPKPSLGPLL